MPIKIVRCNCKHESQDKIYGIQLRVHNQMEESIKWRCTVCGTEREYIESKEKVTVEASKKSKKKGKKREKGNKK